MKSNYSFYRLTAFALISLFFALQANAVPTASSEMNAQEGLDQLKKNKEASQANLDQYVNNLKIVDGNLGELKKASDNARGAAEQLRTANTNHADDMKKIGDSEKECEKLASEETKRKSAEEAKLAEIEKLKLKLQAQIDGRAKNIVTYQQNMTALAAQKKDWQSKSTEFQDADKKIKAELASLASQSKEQQAKKLGYEGEISRWKKEIDRQQKVIDGFQLD